MTVVIKGPRRCLKSTLTPGRPPSALVLRSPPLDPWTDGNGTLATGSSRSLPGLEAPWRTPSLPPKNP
jgi:hypothetical protein